MTIIPVSKNNRFNTNLVGEFLDFERVFDNLFSRGTNISNIGFLDSKIKVDIQEMDNEYYLEAEIPGVKKENINVELEENNLKIEVKSENLKEEVTDDKKSVFVRRERKSNYLSRVFVFDDIKNEEINAKYEDGILKIILPKKEEVKTENKKIEIN